MRSAVLSILTNGLFFFSVAAWGQIGLVHVTSCGGGPFPATACTIPATAAGNLIVVAWSSSFGTTPTVTGVADNAGNIYVEAGNARAVDTLATEMVDIWYAKKSNAGATTVTITPNPSGNVGGAVIWEFSGIDTVSPLDQTSTLNSQPATTSPSGASITTTPPAEAIVSVMVPGGSLTGIHAGNPFTNDLNFFGVGWAHLITSTAGTYAAQWDAPGTYASSTVSFKAAGSGGGTPLNACDLAPPFGIIDSSDVQAAINMALGVSPCTANIIGPGICNVVMVQRVINASLPGGTCVTGSGTVSHSVALTWVASTTPNVTYNIYRTTTSGVYPPTPLASSISATSYTDTAVQSGQTYYYVVTAVNAAGESSHSNESPAAIPVP